MTTENTFTMTDVDPITRVCVHGALDELCAAEWLLSARVRKVPELHCAGIWAFTPHRGVILMLLEPSSGLEMSRAVCGMTPILRWPNESTPATTLCG